MNKADTLSCCPDFHDSSEDNNNVVILPDSIFAQAASLSTLDDQAHALQLLHPDIQARWAKIFTLQKIGDLFWRNNHLVMVDNLPLRRGVIALYDNSPTAGHPGISNTAWAKTHDFWWPNVKQTVIDYIKGCMTCQSREKNPTKVKLPLFPISSLKFAIPFSSIAMDFIVKLPVLNMYDTILTITDTFSKASIFILYNETIDTKKMALLYATYILPHYRLPSQIISDCNPRFTSTFSRELCQMLAITQNISTTYHPQTDSQSECTTND